MNRKSNSWRKKGLSLFLAAIMTVMSFPALSLLFVPAAAADASADVASVNGVNYTSLEDAINAAITQSRATTPVTQVTVELLSDATIDNAQGISIGAENGDDFSIVIDGNGYTVTHALAPSAASGTFYVKWGTVTIKDMTINTTNKNAKAYGAVISRYAKTVVNVENCKINVDGTTGEKAILANTNAILNFVGVNSIKSNFTAFMVAGNAVINSENTLVMAPSGLLSQTGFTNITEASPFTSANEAYIGSTGYATLSAAVDAATSGQTVHLVKDVTTTQRMIKSNAGIVLDGHGFSTTTSVTSQNFAAFEVQKFETTFKNLTVNVNSTNATSWGAFTSRYGVDAGYAGKFIIDNCKVNLTGPASGVFSTNDSGVFEIKNTVIRSEAPVFNAFQNKYFGLTISNTVAYAPSKGYDVDTGSGLTLNVTTDPFGKAEARIGDVYYSSLETAMGVATEGQTVTLLKDVDISSGEGFIMNSTTCKSGTFTVDGDGYTVTSTITGKEHRAAFYQQSLAGTITFKNLTIKVTSMNDNCYGAFIARGGTIVVENCNIEVSGTKGYSALGTGAGGGTLVLNGGNTIKTSLNVFYLFDANGVAVATGENTATGPALGVNNVANLTFTQDPDPFGICEAAIGTKTYLSLTEAFAAAKDGDVITILKDIDVATTGANGRIKCTAGGINLTIDGNGKKISSLSDCTLAFFHDATLDTDNGATLKLTIKDLTVENLATSGSVASTFQINEGVILTLDGCKVYDRSGYNPLGSVIVQAGGTLILTGGTEVDISKGIAIRHNGANAAMTVYNATIVADQIVHAANANSTTNICTGANITAKAGFITSTFVGGVINVSGGEIISQSESAAAIAAPNANTKVNIFGGKISGGNAVYTNENINLAYPEGTTSIELLPTMTKGASVRTVADSAGIRFRTTFSAELLTYVNSVKDEGTSVTYGTLITPSEYIAKAGGVFTIETLDSADGIRGSRYQKIIATDVGTKVNGDGSITINAALVNIKTANYTRDFAATGFICYTVGGVTKYVYTNYSSEDNSRNIFMTACAALADVKNAPEENYVNVVSQYLIKDSEGVYTKATGTAYTKYNETQWTILNNYYKGIANFDEVVLETTTSTVANHTDDIFRTLGRSYTRNGGLVSDFTCTGIEFNAFCGGSVYMKVNSSGATYFTIYVDGVRTENRVSVGNTTTGWVEIAYGLDAADHTIMIVKQGQPSMTQNEIVEIKISGEFKEKPADKELFVEFYGDSILNGSNVYRGGTSAATSDGTRAFGWLAAQEIGADCSIIGRGGLGLANPASGNYSMMDLYNLNGAYGASGVTEYDFARIPDAVVIELGINDKVQGGGISADDYKAAVAEFIGIMREKYGNDTAIIWLYGYNSKDYSASMIEALDELIAAGDSNLYYCEVSPCYLESPADGDIYHPDVAKAEIMGAEVAAHLKNILGIAQ